MTARADHINPGALAALLAREGGDRHEFWAWFKPCWLTVDRGGDALLAEGFAAWRRLVETPAILEWWQSAGLPLSLPRMGLAGAARIRPAEDGWYTPAKMGDPDTTRAVTWVATGGIDTGRVLDIVAMDPGDPARWWRRAGSAELLPSEMQLEWLGEGAAIRLFEYPLEWLRAGCPPGGFCVLDWQSRAGQCLAFDIDAGRFKVACDSDDHAARLRALVRPRRPALQLGVATAGESERQGPGWPRERAVDFQSGAHGGPQAPARAGSEARHG